MLQSVTFAKSLQVPFRSWSRLVWIARLRHRMNHAGPVRIAVLEWPPSAWFIAWIDCRAAAGVWTEFTLHGHDLAFLAPLQSHVFPSPCGFITCFLNRLHGFVGPWHDIGA